MKSDTLNGHVLCAPAALACFGLISFLTCVRKIVYVRYYWKCFPFTEVNLLLGDWYCFAYWQTEIVRPRESSWPTQVQVQVKMLPFNSSQLSCLWPFSATWHIDLRPRVLPYMVNPGFTERDIIQVRSEGAQCIRPQKHLTAMWDIGSHHPYLYISLILIESIFSSLSWGLSHLFF